MNVDKLLWLNSSVGKNQKQEMFVGHAGRECHYNKSNVTLQMLLH